MDFLMLNVNYQSPFLPFIRTNKLKKNIFKKNSQKVLKIDLTLQFCSEI